MIMTSSQISKGRFHVRVDDEGKGADRLVRVEVVHLPLFGPGLRELALADRVCLDGGYVVELVGAEVVDDPVDQAEVLRLTHEPAQALWLHILLGDELVGTEPV